nr:1616_t:CDS:2 [Entrophospora candida]
MTDLLEEFDSMFEVFGMLFLSLLWRLNAYKNFSCFQTLSNILGLKKFLNQQMPERDEKSILNHTGIKIELKDMLGNLRDVLHFKKEDIESIFTVGIQMVTFIVPKTLSEMNNLLIDFIKGLLGLRHILLWLDNKLIQLTKRKYSTPSPASSPPPETSKTPEVKRAKNVVFAILDNLY